MTILLVIAAVLAFVGLRIFRPHAYRTQGLLFIGACIVIGWLLAVGSAVQENANENIPLEEAQNTPLEEAGPPKTQDVEQVNDPENAPMSTDDYGKDEAMPEMNATNTDEQ